MCDATKCFGVRDTKLTLHARFYLRMRGGEKSCSNRSQSFMMLENKYEVLVREQYCCTRYAPKYLVRADNV